MTDFLTAGIQGKRKQEKNRKVPSSDPPCLRESDRDAGSERSFQRKTGDISFLPER